MRSTATFENYPSSIIWQSNILALAVYGAGFYILYRLGWIFSLFYLLGIIAFEYRLLSRHCVDCYYWGKRCAFGKGRISSWFFKKGDTAVFCGKSFTWQDMIPDLMISLVPLLTGIILLILDFDFSVMSAMLLIILLSSAGNGYVRGSLTCNHCKQKEIGCPAAVLFEKK